jgi:hypothetical protein
VCYVCCISLLWCFQRERREHTYSKRWCGMNSP